MSQNVIEKIVQAHAVGVKQGVEVRTGDMVNVCPFHILTHDNTSPVMNKFFAIGAQKIHNRSQPVFALDHDIQNRSKENLKKYDKIEGFARTQGVVFHPAGEGIGHQLMVERGFVHPGSMVVASDSHANMYGALSALGTPVVRTDAAAIWATGQTWWQIPKVIRVTLEGKLGKWVTGKDVILGLCSLYSRGEVLNAALEFDGPGVANLSMSERLTIANMTTEWGALVGWFPFDEVTAEFFRERSEVLAEMGLGNRLTSSQIAQWEAMPLKADEGAEYTAEISLDLSTVRPWIAGPHNVFSKVSEAELTDNLIPLSKAYLLSCVNSRFEDLAAAAKLLDDNVLATGVEFYVAAASAEVERQAEEAGIMSIFRKIGAHIFPPGCGACIGLGAGLLEAGEVGISATNRNFRGRMGSRDARAYLGSPYVVAASAIAGYIKTPDDSRMEPSEYNYRKIETTPRTAAVEILSGFPTEISGRALLLPTDNLNTDGIYGKDVTYRDDLTKVQMATFAMANYDPNFQSIAEEGDIIVSGRNFGTGSSREQAATALAYRGIRMVIAESFSQTYLRNAFNNAFICLESPALVRSMRDCFSEQKAITLPAGGLVVNIQNAIAIWEGETFSVTPLGEAAQELILAGGLEGLTRKRLGL